jgi:zinc transport system substrate-binding protein
MLFRHLVVGLVIVFFGCGGAGPSEETSPSGTGDAKLSVYVVNYPLQYFAERIGGDRVEVHFPAPSDGDPAFWSPDMATVTQYQAADLIMLNGADYAKWVPTVTLPTSKLVDTSEGFKDRIIYEEEAMTHSHGPGGEHSHGASAFTTWLDFGLAVEHAASIRDAFIKARPEYESTFQEGFQALESDLMALDMELEALVADKSQIPLTGSHPVYQYLARRYGLDIQSVHFEPGEMPGQEGWHELEHIMQSHPAKWMLWEGEPLPETKARLEEMGVGSVVFDPCGNKPVVGDFLSLMKNNIATLKPVFM